MDGWMFWHQLHDEYMRQLVLFYIRRLIFMSYARRGLILKVYLLTDNYCTEEVSKVRCRFAEALIGVRSGFREPASNWNSAGTQRLHKLQSRNLISAIGLRGGNLETGLKFTLNATGAPTKMHKPHRRPHEAELRLPFVKQGLTKGEDAFLFTPVGALKTKYIR